MRKQTSKGLMRAIGTASIKIYECCRYSCPMCDKCKKQYYLMNSLVIKSFGLIKDLDISYLKIVFVENTPDKLVFYINNREVKFKHSILKKDILEAVKHRPI